MKVFAYSAASAVAIAVCSTPVPALAQEETPPEATVIPPIVTAAPEGEEAEGDGPSMFDILAQSAQRRLDPEQRAQSLLADLPFTPAIDNEALANRFSRYELIHRSVGIDVPFRLNALSEEGRQGQIWHRGNPPKDGFLGEATATALSAATARMTWKDGSTSDVELYEAQYRDTLDPGSLTDMKGKVYCASDVEAPGGKAQFCLVDRDEDGAFEDYAIISDRTADTVHSAVVMMAAMPMTTPAPYTVRTDALPELRVQWVTCGKDWDLPFYSMRLSRDEHGTEKVYAATNEMYRPYCDKSFVADIPLEDRKSTAAYMGPAVAVIGSKKSGASSRFVELRSAQLLYRIERGDRLARLNEGYAPQQAQIGAVQKFDRLPYQSTGRVETASGTFGLDEPFLTSHFRHGYTGEITQDVKIQLLFSSRSVEGGQAVYGRPAQRKTVVTGPGYVPSPLNPNRVERVVDMTLVWCLPSREEKELRDRERKPTGEIEVIWTATCLPQNSAGSFTILEDQAPALAVRDITYSTSTTTLNGALPVREKAESNFGAPLSFVYAIKEVGTALYNLEERVMLGDEVTSTSVTAIMKDESGKAIVEVAGGSYILESDGEGFKLTDMLEAQEGEDARVKGVDLMELLRRYVAETQRSNS